MQLILLVLLAFSFIHWWGESDCWDESLHGLSNIRSECAWARLTVHKACHWWRVGDISNMFSSPIMSPTPSHSLSGWSISICYFIFLMLLWGQSLTPCQVIKKPFLQMDRNRPPVTLSQDGGLCTVFTNAEWQGHLSQGHLSQGHFPMLLPHHWPSLRLW